MEQELHQVPDYLRKVDENLVQVLLGIEEFKEKKSLIPYFASYEFSSQKQRLLDFWGKTIEVILVQFFGSTQVSVENLLQLFNFNGFSPMGLQKTLSELVKEPNYCLTSDLPKLVKFAGISLSAESQKQMERSEEEVHNISIMGRVLSKLNIFGFGLLPQKIIETNDLVILNRAVFQRSFSKFVNFLDAYNWTINHFSLEVDLYKEAVQRTNLSKDDIQLFLELLSKEGSLRIYQEAILGKRMVFYDKEKLSQSNPDHFKNMTVLYDLSASIEVISASLDKTLQAQAKLKEEMGACNEHMIARKKQITREYLILQQNVDQLLNKKHTLIQNRLQVEAAIENKRVITVLNQGIHATKQNQIDVSHFEDVREHISETAQHEKDVAEAFASMNELTESEKNELEKELELLDSRFDIIPRPNIQVSEPKRIKQTGLVQTSNFNCSNKDKEMEVEDPNMQLLLDLA